MKKTTILILILFAVLLSGCSSLNSNFDCPMKPGVRCESLDQVNAQVDRGEISHSDIKMTTINQPITTMSGVTKQPLYKDASYLNKGEPLRYGETIMRVWVAPYEDTSGNYHQESDVYTIVKPSHWIGYPPKQSNVNEE